MIGIIVTGFFSFGIIPLLAAMGYGIELLVNFFASAEWTYWQCVAVAFAICALPVIRLAFHSSRRTGE